MAGIQRIRGSRRRIDTNRQIDYNIYVLERLSNIQKLTVEGNEHLDEVRRLNAEGRHCIFAPNHLQPQGALAAIRKQSALADDYPVLSKVLADHGIHSRVVVRGDTDMKVGESRVRRFLYETHRRMFSAVGRSTGGVPMSLNTAEPGMTSVANTRSVKDMEHALDTENLTLYPYGNWFKTGEQKFDVQADMEGGNKFVKKSEGMEKYRMALKRGFIFLSRQKQAPIVPVYVRNDAGHWTVRFGAPMLARDKQDDVEVAKAYLDVMRGLSER
jgi:hypothetical protein